MAGWISDVRTATRSLSKSPWFAAVAAILAGVALIASWIPARRAARVDPIRVLLAD